MNERIVRTVDVAIGGRRYRISSDDEYLSQLGSEFEPRTTALFNTLFDQKAVVLDVGANIGCTSLLFGARARRVIAFEPSPTTFRFLRDNIQRAGLQNVELHNVGLGRENGSSMLTFALNNRSGGFISDTAASSGHVTEEIEIRRLDDMAAELAITHADFVKIDVEGFERNVLEGGRQFVARVTPVVALELNHWCLNAFQRICVPDFFDYLRSVFPLVFAVEGDTYLDIRDAAERYIVMYHHINHLRYVNLIGAFRETQLRDFRARFRHSS
jgi:FkbM family methyltransferase